MQEDEAPAVGTLLTIAPSQTSPSADRPGGIHPHYISNVISMQGMKLLSSRIPFPFDCVQVPIYDCNSGGISTS